MDSVGQLTLSVGFVIVCITLSICKLNIDYRLLERRVLAIENYSHIPFMNPVRRVPDQHEDPV